ncbi:hypothetical protein RRG08_010191 [Elysia crispata]|uniref:Uncharacterized protein n=1 Tax=Elysia crispata TaxID=231223 RepID=A0AAE1DZY6_9GAST|nr:hypothetical protein RRG08_010191 [Elysia crispata]
MNIKGYDKPSNVDVNKYKNQRLYQILNCRSGQEDDEKNSTVGLDKYKYERLCHTLSCPCGQVQTSKIMSYPQLSMWTSTNIKDHDRPSIFSVVEYEHQLL